MNILKGLHPAQDIHHEAPSGLMGVAPLPPKTKPHDNLCQYSTDGPLNVELTKFELAEDVSEGEMKRLMEECRGRIQMETENQDRLVPADTPVQPTGFSKVKISKV